jgi:hypothetical protein
MSYADGPREFEGDDPITPETYGSDNDDSVDEINQKERGILTAYINSLIDDPALKVEWDMVVAIIKMADLSNEQMEYLVKMAKGTVNDSPLGSSPTSIEMYLKGLNEKISNTLRRMKMKKD